MTIVKVFPSRFISIAFLLIFLQQPAHNVSETSRHRLSSPAYIQRGDQVERRYEAYSRRLARYHNSLSIALKDSAPDLLAHLQALESIRLGYQILPRIIADAPSEEHARAKAVAYSWPWTERLIDRAMKEIDRAETELHRAQTMNAIQSRAVLERLALDYRRQNQGQENIDAHVRYNRLWQAAIAADRPGYDRETALQMQVLERQKILDRLKRVNASYEKYSVSFHESGAAGSLLGMTRSLQSRAALLARRIDQAMNEMPSPLFIKIENSAADWIFHVPLFTDIEDRDFVTEVKRIIETTWRLAGPKNTYRVELDVSYISADLLYADSGKPPQGVELNIRRHLERFPAGGAILTTGAVTTHVQDYAIVLGPHPVSPQLLAHEFGHILGFRDRYIRGYKNLGENGFQIMEVIADPRDIMAATAHGLVLPNHFSSLVHRATKTNKRNAPEPKLIKVNRLRS